MEDIKKLLSSAKNITMSAEDKEMLLNEHPLQFIDLTDPFPLMFYRVDYTYSTGRGNKKTGKKIFILNTYSPEVDMKVHLDEWVERFNKRVPYRPLLNVQILKSRCLGFLKV